MIEDKRVFGKWCIFKASKLIETTNDYKEAQERAEKEGLLVIKTAVLIEKGYESVINGI